jgi:hypothetical protein
MVYVTEIHAVIQGISVDYTMSGIERQICGLISVQLSRYLNDWFYGLVSFEVDTYFTTVAVGNESFTYGYSGLLRDYFIMANDIPEVSEMLEDYGSVVTTFCMNDYGYVFHHMGGVSDMKYSACYLETVLRGFVINDIPLEAMLDTTDLYWEFVMEHYLHEFTHTVEISLDVYEFHVALGYTDNNRISKLEITKLYLLNQLAIDGQKEGIPYGFWTGEIKRNWGE